MSRFIASARTDIVESVGIGSGPSASLTEGSSGLSVAEGSDEFSVAVVSVLIYLGFQLFLTSGSFPLVFPRLLEPAPSYRSKVADYDY